MSQKLLQWYRQLLRLNAAGTVRRLNERIEVIREILPTAAQVLEQALQEADMAAAA